MNVSNQVKIFPSALRQAFASFSGPSGGGKTTMVNAVAKHVPGAAILRKYTNRTPRPGELDGVDYFFVSDQWFDEALSQGILVTYEEYYGNRYGLGANEVLQAQCGRSTLMLVILNPILAKMFAMAYPRTVTFFCAPQPPTVASTRVVSRGLPTREVEIRRSFLEAELTAASCLDAFLNSSLPIEDVVRQALTLIGRKDLLRVQQ